MVGDTDSGKKAVVFSGSGGLVLLGRRQCCRVGNLWLALHIQQGASTRFVEAILLAGSIGKSNHGLDVNMAESILFAGVIGGWGNVIGRLQSTGVATDVVGRGGIIA